MPMPSTASAAAPVPHRTRPLGHLLSGIVAISLAASALVATAAPALAHGGDALREAVNSFRADEGLAPVFGTELLDDIAAHRASRLVAIDRLEHDIDYVTRRLNQAHVCWGLVGEIIAWERGYPDYDANRTALAWFNSDDHHAIMMGERYNAAGGAWSTGDDGAHYSVMVFVELCGAATASESQVRLLHPSDTYSPDRPLVFSGGRHTGYRFDVNGVVLARRTHSYGHSVTRTARGRTYVGGHAYLKVSSGALRGLWVRESARAYVRGVAKMRLFDDPNRVVLAKGHYHGVRFGRRGGVYDSKDARYWHRHAELASAKGVINGRNYVKLTTGKLAGYWVLDTRAVDLR